MNKDTLKKHHFWILVGFVPLLVLIAVFTITSAVGGKIEEKNAAIKKATDDLNGKNPKSNKLIDRVDEQVVKLGKKRTDLWRDNWERQIGVTTRREGGKEVRTQDPTKNLVRWPKSPKLARFNYTADYATDKEQLKFGAKIPSDNGEFNELRKPEVYLAEFSNPFLKDPAREPEKRTGMADMVYPTAFAGGRWQAVLRHVNDWGEQVPSPEQVWLALEDIWVQRAMLTAVKAVNDEIGQFVRVERYENGKALPDTPLERSFQSRVWQVNLKVEQRTGDQKWAITGTLRNLTDRLQLLGNGNTMVLNVWLSADPNARPFAFKIGGEYVPGNETRPIESPEHTLPPGVIPTEIHRVEQVFDTRTVPVRRIDHLVLGYRDSRFAAKPLELPRFKRFEDEEAASAAAGTATGSPMGVGSSAGPPPPGVGSSAGTSPQGVGPSAGPPGLPGMTPGATGWPEGGGDVATVIDANKKRYVEKPTLQVRRMPVAITLIVDQAYMQDVLLAYANSPLRFQITQVDWQRFRGPLGGGTGSGEGFGIGGEDMVAGPARGYEGAGLKLGGMGGLMPAPGGFGSAVGPPGGPPLPGGPTPPGIGGFGPGAYSPSGMGGIYGAGSMPTLTESQLTAGLVELTVYGIVSLYEKYEAEAAATAAADQPAK